MLFVVVEGSLLQQLQQGTFGSGEGLAARRHREVRAVLDVLPGCEACLCGEGGAAMSAVHYDSYTDARTHLKDLLDAAERGRVATVRRDARTTAFVDQERLRCFLAAVTPSGAQVVAEDGGWSVFIPGLPVAADGASFDEALDEMIIALREYADDWQDHLLDAPNHTGNWGLVQLVSLSDDNQLREWLVGSGR
jgi:predicted RNase H-like HicB family nuclease